WRRLLARRWCASPVWRWCARRPPRWCPRPVWRWCARRLGRWRLCHLRRWWAQRARWWHTVGGHGVGGCRRVGDGEFGRGDDLRVRRGRAVAGWRRGADGFGTVRATAPLGLLCLVTSPFGVLRLFTAPSGVLCLVTGPFGVLCLAVGRGRLGIGIPEFGRFRVTAPLQPRCRVVP